MKIVIFCPFIAKGRGGLERVGIELANAMAERGHKIYLAYNAWGDCKPVYPVSNKVVLIPWEKPYPDFRNKLLEINPNVFFVFNGGYRLMDFYKAVCGSAIPFAYQEATNPRRLCNDNWAQIKKIFLGQAAWEREILASAAVRIRQTMPSYAFSLPAYIRPQIRFFPNAIIPAGKIAKQDANNAAIKTIINIGGLKRVKNIMPLLKAFSDLSPDFPDWQINVFGKGFHSEADYQNSIHSFVNKARLEDRVSFMGESKEIYKEYEKSHIHVITSKDEGRPTCVSEAMSHALPSIGLSSCPGTNELIRHEYNGLLVNTKDNLLENLKNALQRLMSSSKERVRLGQQAYEDSKAFWPEKVYDKWEMFFVEAAAYRDDIEKLYRQQTEIDRELAMHARRVRQSLYLPK